MKTTVVKTKLDAPIQEVWKVIGAVGGVDTWSPVITSCEVRSSKDGGLERICSSDEGTLKERILKLDNSSMTLSYTIYEQPFLPVTELVSTIELSESDSKTVITTTSEYNLNEGADEDEVAATISQIYGMSYQGIENLISAKV